MSLFESLSIVALLIAGAFAVLMLWYHTSQKLEETKFQNQTLVSQQIQKEVNALFHEFTRFRDKVDAMIGGLASRVNALEISFNREIGELKSSEKLTQDAYRRFSAEFDQLRRGWGQPIGGDRFLVPEPKKK